MYFKERLDAPVQGNKYFTKTTKGGYNKAILGTPRLWEGCVLSNCVGQAIGRFMESQKLTSCNLSTGNAGGMYLKADGYKRGKTPKVGAVLCYHKTGGGKTVGHVEFVERVYDNGNILTSYSAYNGTAYGTHYLSKPYNKKGYEVQGFIYPVKDFEILDPTLEVNDKVRIVGVGNARADGTGHRAYGLGWSRIIKRILPGTEYPYQVGTKKGTTGFYKKEALKEIK